MNFKKTAIEFGRSSVLIATLALTMTLATACSHLPTTNNVTPSAGGTDAAANVEVAGPDGVQETPAAADLNDSGSDLRAIPMGINRMVLTWIDYFQGQGRPHMERYLSRSTRYMPIMKKILREKGLPEDLIYIALIESGFSATAHSSASAVGYWQFIKGTGKRYNLKIDSYVDERRDFVKATYAAAGYFGDLYQQFGAWYLAVASYNVGEGRVKKLTEKYRTRDFWQLARENKLPEETINYVPKFIAARLIAKEPEKYGFTDLEYMAPLEFSEVDFTSSIDIRKLAKEMNVEYDDLRDLNPSWKRGVAFEKAGKLTLRVPKGTETLALAGAANAAAESKQRYVADEDYGYYKVRRGDTIALIAKRFGTSQRDIRSLNKLKAGTRLVAGRRLRVPGETIGGLSSGKSSSNDVKPVKADKVPSSASGSTAGSGPALAMGIVKQPKVTGALKEIQPRLRKALEARRIHVVRKGDTLIEIARRYSVPLRALATRNKIGRRGQVLVGTRLEIP